MDSWLLPGASDTLDSDSLKIMCVLQWVSENKTSCVWPWYVIRVMLIQYDRGMWSVLWERVPILFVQLENVEISRESRFRSLTCQTSYFARFHTIIGSSCASPNFMWWWCLKFVRKCSQYKFCNGWVDPSLDHWEYFGISTTFVKSIIRTPWIVQKKWWK